MKKRIRPAQEEMRGCTYTVLFMILWYGLVIRSFLTSGFEPMLLIFVAGGLIPLLAVAKEIQRAMFYRRERRRAVESGRRQRGRITGYTRKAVVSGTKNGRDRYRTYYFLQVEIYATETGVATQFLSEGYSRPIYKYLGGTDVTVYTDESGWHHYLEDFHWKERPSDPDIFSSPREFQPSGGIDTAIKVIAVVVMVLMFLFIVLGL